MELLTFVTSATYFQFDGVIYSQIEGFAMGNPMSAILSNIFMEDLESKAIPSAPEEVGLSLWKRYVDDTLEKIKRGQVIPLTEHLNGIDVTGNIKFTYDQENEGKLAFLDVLLSRRPDGSIKIQIYRKPTHTDAYLMFDSHHPFQHKFSVIRTLLGRNHEIVTEEADRVDEEAHVVAALKNCKYPEQQQSKQVLGLPTTCVTTTTSSTSRARRLSTVMVKSLAGGSARQSTSVATLQTR